MPPDAHAEEPILESLSIHAFRWRRTLYAVAAGEVLAIAGFSTSTPIVPFFLQDLGVTDPVRLKLLTGLAQTLPSLSLMIFSTIWGSIADSYGRKPMLLRAMLGGTVVMVLQGVVSAPWQLIALRTLQGCITGTVAAATILVASIAPPEELGYSLGFLQMSVFVGASLGPLFGGLIADLLGRRMNFFATSVLLLAAGILVWRFVDDNFQPPVTRKPILQTLMPDFRPLASSRALVSLMAVIAADQIAGSIPGPFLPLFILSISPNSARVGSMTGLVLGLGAVASALAAVSIGRISFRLGYKRTLVICMTGAAVFMIPQAFARTPVQLLVLRVASCFFVGGNMPSANALIAQRTPTGKRGSILGLANSISSGSSALGPAIGATIALAGGYPSVFLTTAGILAFAGGAILLFIKGPAAGGARERAGATGSSHQRLD